MQNIAQLIPQSVLDSIDVDPIKTNRCRWHGEQFGNECEVCAFERQRVKMSMFAKCEEMGLAKPYHCLRFEDYWQRNDGQVEALGCARRLVAGDLRSAVFAGSEANEGFGTGKTTLAAMILYEFFLAGKGVGVYSTALRVSRSGLDVMNADSKSTRQHHMDSFINPPLLVMDELAAKKPNAFECDLISEILAERLEHGRTTVVISNKPISFLKTKVLHGRTIDRLRTQGALIVFDWESARRLGEW